MATAPKAPPGLPPCPDSAATFFLWKDLCFPLGLIYPEGSETLFKGSTQDEGLGD